MFLTVIPHLLTVDECKALIAREEPNLSCQNPTVGLYWRTTFSDDALCDRMFRRVLQELNVTADANQRYHLPAGVIAGRHDGWELVGVHNEIRLAKYRPGGKFPIHQDGMVHDRAHGTESVLTVNMFLNSEFVGGSTDFLRTRSDGQADETSPLLLSVTAAPGTACLFDMRIWHRGGLVTQGCKYVLRTYVMARPPTPTPTPSPNPATSTPTRP